MVRNQPNCILNTCLFPDAAFLPTDTFSHRILKHITKMAITIAEFWIANCKAEVEDKDSSKIPLAL